jgi:transcriptional regulator with GAF, ATPase, and Fis domain
VFVIGTGSSAHLRLRDAAVSREHLRLYPTALGVRCVDEGSKNGTFVGASQVHSVTLKRPGDLTLGNTTLRIELSGEPRALPISDRSDFGEAIGESPAMRHVFSTLERAADTDLTILFEGESGVGKDVLARAVHAKSRRAAGPFVVLDCGAIAPQLIESELFGHVRGAFTGATRDRIGAFETAHGGTVFLDEVGELPLELQPKLLRALERREVQPVGSEGTRSFDVRVLAATNRSLSEGVRLGEFRSDLFFRLGVVRVAVPPLRERPEDILLIATRMLRTITGDPAAAIPRDLERLLVGHPWPGNVRELRNVMERVAALGVDEALPGNAPRREVSLDDALLRLSYHEGKKTVCDRFDEFYIPRILDGAEGVVARAAEDAGISRQAFHTILQRLRRAPGDVDP